MNRPASPTASLAQPQHFALIPAAGVGARMGADIPKQYMALAGKPMLRHALDTFAAHARIAHTFVVVSAADGWIDDLLPPELAPRATVLRVGGATRQESVFNGLNEMRNVAGEADWVLVHDAARPGLDAGLIDRLLDALSNDEVGGLLALPVVDTLKREDAGGRSQQTVPRAGLWAAQTPQMFRYALLQRALRQAAEQGRIGAITDDASAIEMLGLRPRLVEGSPRNLKVTLAQDAALAEFFLKG
ncbi:MULTISPECIES: 2-C-methyl-D-erythritol 4-phosphate cytidylyltransferase [unclassified Herbaspirillum]|uniref:2-C-methyl-D-erythritol 4-phosphate cytidylyltransferase n=1 Tax=unclassified Herbaspirillum TaxID=2624150 RepID=UPI0011504AB9|nr:MULTISPECIES: 2-C-methyl-D-erythritol 4-phosphate cytidylyltransferase [unclassified Herbaspirillum]MBB5393638.1 2-C-methyl-D-erythritol 4-phosphate cytidylyltransferase [Herbaspirillum sp. SJZ102]TQK03616.1 2-C-methyl-D-erythritol 4-phosphate cytidylyltransferase [Herbaspirillum sp. SJZ130]TQK08348.1 2-C-methyl-D-erythritol 4-phosphate cytidylyltransferase [Herbaspirillum sp. SJZ106]